MYLATPATQVLLALREAMLEVKEEGIETRWARHRRLGGIVRDRVGGWGQEFVAEEGHRSDTVTSFLVENGKAGAIQKALEVKHNVMVARGVYDDRDRMIRIGHFGILSPELLERSMDQMGGVMEDLGLLPKRVIATKRRRRN